MYVLFVLSDFRLTTSHGVKLKKSVLIYSWCLLLSNRVVTCQCLECITISHCSVS